MEKWEQQPGEPTRWFTRFQTYINLGTERTIEAAFRRTLPEMSAQVSTGKQKSAKRPSITWYEMAKDWDWVGRAQAYDRENARKLSEAKAKAIADMMERHAAAAMMAYNHSVNALMGVDPAKLPPALAMQMLKTATEMERIARGVPASPKAITEVPHAPQPSQPNAPSSHIDQLSDRDRSDLLTRLFRPRPVEAVPQQDDGSGESDHGSDPEGE